jgi:hypothetical protein
MNKTAGFSKDGAMVHTAISTVQILSEFFGGDIIS